MNIVVISNTHELNEELGVLCGDVLIHCGDSAFGNINATLVNSKYELV